MSTELQIERLSYGGRGMGWLDGMAVFVPDTAPGDRIECRIVRRKKRHAEGELVRVLEAGPNRVAPHCPFFGRCGGCQWQHLDYDLQALWKDQILADLVCRQAGVAQEALEPIIPAPDPWGYRSRVQFKCHQSAAGMAIGFYRKGSRFVEDVRFCPIADPRINEVLSRLRKDLPGSPEPERIPQVDVAVDDRGALRAVVHYIGEKPQGLIDFLRPWGEECGLSLFLQTGRKETLHRICGREDLFIDVGGEPPLLLGYGPGGFAQVNLAQNRTLVRLVLAGAALEGDEKVLDLFCGMGNFSLPLALAGAEVTGVEDFPPSIAKARENARRCGVTRARFIVASAEGGLGAYLGGDGCDLAVLDPPRSGARGAADALLELRPRRIIYVSCDPATLARDLKMLRRGGYEVSSCRAIDLFPQTYHIESITILECR